MAFCIDLITRNIDGCIKSIGEKTSALARIDKATASLLRSSALECDPPHYVLSLRALEAGTQGVFSGMAGSPLQWKGITTPIPNLAIELDRDLVVPIGRSIEMPAHPVIDAELRPR